MILEEDFLNMVHELEIAEMRRMMDVVNAYMSGLKDKEFKELNKRMMGETK